MSWTALALDDGIGSNISATPLRINGLENIIMSNSKVFFVSLSLSLVIYIELTLSGFTI